jgi:hypothetical protein
MHETCPLCGGKLTSHGTTREVRLIRRRRDCVSCEYSDVATIEPEVIISVRQVVRIRRKRGVKDESWGKTE